MKRLIVPALLVLSACGTPQEQCINRNTRDLRNVDRLIAESKGNLDRGFAYEEVLVYRDVWVFCDRYDIVDGHYAVQPRMCLDDRPEFETRPKAIDLAAEAKKLKSLEAKRVQLARAAQPVIAQCQAQYPE
ncbi:hypothetical protein [Tabrizicola sp. BL-A-41-H6]|uniref:hypothetical protein n=1 Tax=Tabrizicola sp. BL-A-41-H6 TaxID=3421107 RepID=UPI003D67678B